MSRENESQNGYTMETESPIGEVKIADDVVATIAGLATTEVEGVASMQGNLTNEIVGKIEDMTGPDVESVNIRIVGVETEKGN